jgi:hypothetical protein
VLISGSRDPNRLEPNIGVLHVDLVSGVVPDLGVGKGTIYLPLVTARTLERSIATPSSPLPESTRLGRVLDSRIHFEIVPAGLTVRFTEA